MAGARASSRSARVGSGFAFDSERPRHRVFLAGHEIANRRVTNKEWREFIDDGGYRTPALWLSDGWAWVQQEGISAPLYWRDDGTEFTLARPPRDRLGGARLRTSAITKPTPSPAGPARGCRPRRSGKISPPPPIPMVGNQLDACRPARCRDPAAGMFGDVWEWTQSAFASYPGFAPAEGAVGEYNGKFMSGQLVLKGASCATPRGHSRASYRNFFPPGARWQFTGVRLARDA